MKYMLIPFFLIVLAFSAHADLRAGLVSYYKFDSHANDSVGSNHGTVVGATLDTTNQKLGVGCYDFDGNDYISVGALTTIRGTNNFTISTWIKPESLPSTGFTILASLDGASYQPGYTFGCLNSDGTLYFVADNLGTGGWDMVYNTSAGAIAVGNWYHVVMVRNGSTWNMYVNNNAVGSVTQGSGGVSIGVGSFDSRIGYAYNDVGANGLIDEVAIWNRALTDDERTALYNAGAGLQYPFFFSLPNITNIVCTSPTPDDDTPPYVTDDFTPTFTFNTESNAWCRISTNDLGYSGMTTNCTSTGTTNHTCSVLEELQGMGTHYIYLACADAWGGEHNASNNYEIEVYIPNANQTTSQQAMDAGLSNSAIWPGAVIHTDQQVYLRDLNNNQKLATIDRVAVYGNQRWLLNYENSTALGLFNLTPVVYSLDLTGNMTYTQIKDAVEAFIASTKN